MDLYNLGKVSWQDSQLMYHALAKLGRESLCLISPASPYVCIGFHQDAAQEVDLDFCRANAIPVFRRRVGGGAVYLDGNQLFFQLILHRNNPIAPKQIEAFYKKFLQPVIEVHHRIGIAAAYKPVNDLIVESRKISGTGAAEIGDSIVFVGNLILDFDYGTMSRVLKIPDEKFRDKVRKTIEENLSTIKRELGEQNCRQWDETTLNRMLAEEFEKLLGNLKPALKDQALIAQMKALEASMFNDAWLFQRGKQVEGRVVKIRADLEVVQNMHKAPGGLIRAEFAVEDNEYKSVHFSGDFFSFPEDSVARLAAVLEDCPTADAPQVIEDFYQTNAIDIPGVTPDDWMKIIRI
jgi:lipoate-protein ligase A